jgi:ATP phosphoribosyltransferase
MLKSEAHLVASLAAPWRKPQLAALRALLDRIAAEAAGRALRAVTADPRDAAMAAKLAAERFGARAPFGAGQPLVLHCPQQAVAELAEWLRHEMGAATVSVSTLGRIYQAAAPLYDRLAAKLG